MYMYVFVYIYIYIYIYMYIIHLEGPKSSQPVADSYHFNVEISKRRACKILWKNKC